MFMRKVIPALLFTVLVTSAAKAQQDLQVNGLKLGMSIEQAALALGPGFKLVKANRPDGIEQVVLYKQDVGYSLLALNHRLYFISYGQAFPSGQELNSAKVKADLRARFGNAVSVMSQREVGGDWGFDANKTNVLFNNSCALGLNAAFPGYSRPRELERVNLMLPSTFSTQGSCPYVVRVAANTQPTNPDLVYQLGVSIFDRQAALSIVNNAQNAAEQQRQADANAAKKRQSPF